MKKILLSMFIVALLSSSISADERKPIILKCLSPLEVVVGAGCYTTEVGCKMLKGTKDIIMSPFNSKFCFPKPKTIEWYRGYFVPPKFKLREDKHKDMYELELDIHDPPMVYPLHIEPPTPKNFIVY